MKKLLILLLTLAACSDFAIAQTEGLPHDVLSDGIQVMSWSNRPVTSTLQLQLGTASVRNTYLTPLLYTGQSLGLGYQRARDWKGHKWMSLQSLVGQFTMGEDRGEHGENWSGRIRYRYAAQYQWESLWDIRLMAGPYLNAETGFDYNLKMASSNNPAAARAVANAGVSLMGRYNYRLWSRHSVVTLLMQAPLLGYALVPEYGASYYETFYLEGAENLHHFTSIHNQQDLDLELTTDIPVLLARGGALRLGVSYHIETMKINQTTTRFSSFEAVVGWTFQCLPSHAVNF